jgi:hypothetical protein
MRALRLVAALALPISFVAGCGSARAPGAFAPGSATSSPAATQPYSTPSPSPAPAASPRSSPSSLPTSPGYAPPWPSTPRTAVSSGRTGYLTTISVGRQPAYDRIVFRFSGGIPGYDIRYVSQVLADPKGDLVPLPGQAFLRIVFHPTMGQPAYRGPSVISPVFPALLQLKAAGDFEGYLSFGAGLSSRAGFNVLTLTQPDRLVIDVAHGSLRPFPGIWDITSWPQFWSTQIAYNEGHQPWLANPLMVVQAWAAGRWTVTPTIRQAGPDTYTVTEPGTNKVATVSGTRPITVGPAQLWVITKISYGTG